MSTFQTQNGLPRLTAAVACTPTDKQLGPGGNLSRRGDHFLRTGTLHLLVWGRAVSSSDQE